MDDESAEDNYSLAKHEDVMAKEMMKMRPNIPIIMDLMKRTTLSRARDMEKSTTLEILQKFPYLQIPSLVSIVMPNHVHIIMLINCIYTYIHRFAS